MPVTTDFVVMKKCGMVFIGLFMEESSNQTLKICSHHTKTSLQTLNIMIYVYY